MALPTLRRTRLGGLAAAALTGTALLTLGVGASVASAADPHPCEPGETDYADLQIFTDNSGTSFAVVFCGGPTTRSPYPAQDGAAHPCELGETDTIGAVPASDENGNDIDPIWLCADGGPTPPPGLLPSYDVGDDPAPLTADGPALRFTPVGPSRVVDTRRPGGAALSAGEVRRIDLSGALPVGSLAAAVNVTAANAAAPGYLSAWDCDGAAPSTSIVNFGTGGAAAANTIVQVGPDLSFCVFSSAATGLLVDVNGAYSPSGAYGYTALSPNRIFDSRNAGAPVPAGSTTRVTIPNLATTPRAAFLNLTVAGPAADGYLTVWPCSTAMPEVSNLNYPAGVSAIANAAQVPVDPNGEVCIYNYAATTILVDVFGVYDDAATGKAYQPITPVRVLDTRDYEVGGWIGAIGNSQAIDIALQAPGAAVVGTVTAVDPPQAGFLFVAAGDAAATPTVSNLNADRGTIANMFTSPSASSLKVQAGPTGGENVLVDITGAFV